MAKTEPYGPFERWPVSLDGHDVPHVEVRPTPDGKFYICVDRRFIIHKAVTQEELDNWMPIMANAMAVAAGYSCFGESSAPINPYKVKVGKLDAPPPSLRVVKDQA